MTKLNFNKIFKERWKFYVFSYIIGYVFSLYITGTPSLVYYVPIKLYAIAFSVILGNTFYHASQKMPAYKYPMKNIKYLLILSILLIIFYLIKAILLPFGIDITPFIGAYKVY